MEASAGTAIYGTVFSVHPLTPELVRVVLDGPVPRRFTVRRWDPTQRHLTIDFVTHGDTGTAGHWAQHAQRRHRTTAGLGPGPHPRQRALRPRVHPHGPAHARLQRIVRGAAIREDFTVHFLPIYNPDGSEANTRETVLWDRAADAPVLGYVTDWGGIIPV